MSGGGGGAGINSTMLENIDPSNELNINQVYVQLNACFFSPGMLPVMEKKCMHGLDIIREKFKLLTWISLIGLFVQPVESDWDGVKGVDVGDCYFSQKQDSLVQSKWKSGVRSK